MRREAREKSLSGRYSASCLAPGADGRPGLVQAAAKPQRSFQRQDYLHIRTYDKYRDVPDPCFSLFSIKYSKPLKEFTMKRVMFPQ